MCKCGGASEHEHLGPVTVSKSLFTFIVKERCSVLNSRKPEILHERVLREKYLTETESTGLMSECDDQLLINIMFAGTVKVKGIEISGSKTSRGKWPTRMKVFVNVPNADFTNVDGLPMAQEFVLLTTSDDSLPLRYSTRAAKFFNVNTLTLLIEGASDSGNQIEIDYLGFEGEFSQSRIGAVKADYEVKPMLTDHKSIETVNSTIN